METALRAVKSWWGSWEKDSAIECRIAQDSGVIGDPPGRVRIDKELWCLSQMTTCRLSAYPMGYLGRTPTLYVCAW